MNLVLHKACLSDVPALGALIDASVRGLQSSDYTPAQIDSALQSAFSVDTQLIEDGTYFIAQIDNMLAGCGGWSKRRKLCGGSDFSGSGSDMLDPSRDAAKIRAIFVHPDYARRGIGSLLLKAAENAAVMAGFTRLEMGATLTGVPLYRLRGYTAVAQIEVPLSDGLTLPVVRMEKIMQR